MIFESIALALSHQCLKQLPFLSNHMTINISSAFFIKLCKEILYLLPPPCCWLLSLEVKMHALSINKTAVQALVIRGEWWWSDLSFAWLIHLLIKYFGIYLWIESSQSFLWNQILLLLLVQKHFYLSSLVSKSLTKQRRIVLYWIKSLMLRLYF